MPQKYSKTYKIFASIHKCMYKKEELVFPLASLLLRGISRNYSQRLVPVIVVTVCNWDACAFRFS